MEGCFYGNINERFEDIIKHWNSKKQITKHIGRIRGNKAKDVDAELYLKDIAEHLFRVPFNTDFTYNQGMVNRMKREIDKIENNYRSKKINTFQKYFYVSDAIANYSPVTRVFYNKVNEAINFERNNMDNYLSSTKVISDHIKKALVHKTGKSKSEIKNYLNKLADLEAKILNGEIGSTDYLAEYQSLFDVHGGGVINDYIKLLEMPTTEFNKQRFQYDRHTQRAAEHSRKLLKDMGGVFVNGLDRMENVVRDMWDSPIITKSAKSYITKINEAKKKIAKGVQEGNYFPRYLLSNLVEANYKMKALAEAKNEGQLVRATEQLTEVFNNVETLIPEKARSRNEQINTIWSKNPFFVLTQYAKDAIAFNKINFIQEAYVPAIRKFQKSDANPEFIKSMRTFIEDTFQISTKGLMERPNWVNATVRGLMAVETLKSMGLSVTGALRNGASAAYFFTENGVSSATKAIKKYNANIDGMRDKVNKVEKDQGFEFTEGGRELVAEGLIPSTKNVTDIVYDPIAGKIKYRDKGALKTLDPMVDWAVGRSLIFHRWTENASRKWMFRVAWVQAYQRLKGHMAMTPETYANKKNPAQSNDDKLMKMATNFALQTVNKFAFEYAGHAKARAIGGTAPRGKLGEDGLPEMKAKDYASALGEVTFQFLHYPMSFLNLQAKVLTGAKDAVLSGQTDAPEIKQALRFAGIYAGVSALSVGMNLDFTNTLENDTVRRIQDIKDYLTLDPKELEGRKRGLINDFTGPIVGDIFYALNMFQLYEMPDEYWKKMLRGYIDYYDEGHVPDFVDPKKKIDTTEKRHMWNKLNTQLARILTKDIPAIRDGRGMDVLRHELGWYPRAELKKKREAVNKYSQEYLGFKPFKKSKKKGKGSAEDNLLKLVSELQNR